jgi:methylmalonyl-CoA mutase
MNKDYKLDEFKIASSKVWLEKVNKDLKESPIESLNWKFDGDEYSPFYVKEQDEQKIKLIPSVAESILNFQKYNIEDDSFKELSLIGLNNGLDGLICELTSVYNLQRDLSHILIPHCHLCLSSKTENLIVSDAYQAYLDSLEIDFNNVKGLGYWYEVMKMDWNKDRFEFNANLIYKIVDNSKCPNFRNILIDSSLFVGSEYSPSKEIGISLSLLVHTINALIEKGIELETIASNIFINTRSNTNYFAEIAKLRAFRILVESVFNEYDNDINILPYFHMEINVSNEHNYLIHTTEAMSSLIGGVNSFNITPSTKSKQDRRIAINVMNILKEEAYMDKTNDPSAGSYYIDNLTNRIANNAWNIFKTIEESGGVEKYTKSGELRKLMLNDE